MSDPRDHQEETGRYLGGYNEITEMKDQYCSKHKEIMYYCNINKKWACNACIADNNTVCETHGTSYTDYMGKYQCIMCANE